MSLESVLLEQLSTHTLREECIRRGGGKVLLQDVGSETLLEEIRRRGHMQEGTNMTDLRVAQELVVRLAPGRSPLLHPTLVRQLLGRMFSTFPAESSNFVAAGELPVSDASLWQAIRNKENILYGAGIPDHILWEAISDDGKARYGADRETVLERLCDFRGQLNDLICDMKEK